MSTTVSTTELRARFAARLSTLYASEVPAYQQLVDVSAQVNADVLRETGENAEQLGSLARVTAERHGAVRVGTPAELAQLAGILAAFGMHPVGFYDLRDAAPSPIPVVSTAFRPIEAGELEHNPFRLFVSVLVPQDKRFFDADLGERVQQFLNARTLFPPRLLELADQASAAGELALADAEELLSLAVTCQELDDQPIDRGWYDQLQRVSSVAADIAGVPSTHINHLTPRVLDIDLLHWRMTALGVQMLDRIEGPPRWTGPEVLLRQTSFRALDEKRLLLEADGTVVEGALRVRFGEVEARGVALTAAGRLQYDAALVNAAARSTADQPYGEVLAQCWAEHFPGQPRWPGTLRARPLHLHDGSAARPGGTGNAHRAAGQRLAERPPGSLRGLPAQVRRRHLLVQPGQPGQRHRQPTGHAPRHRLARRAAGPAGARPAAALRRPGPAVAHCRRRNPAPAEHPR